MGERGKRSGSARTGHGPTEPAGPPAHWINDAIDHLPVAVGLVGEQGTYVARSGKLGALLGDIIASRSGNLRSRWDVKDLAGKAISPEDWPSERALRGESQVHNAYATFQTADNVHQLRITAAPFIDTDGKARSFVMMQDCALEKSIADNRAFLEAGYAATIYDVLQTLGQKGPTVDIEEAKAMFSRRLGLPMPVMTTPAEDGLSNREAEVFRLIGRGYTHKEIGERLGLKPRTVEFYRGEGLQRLNLNSRADIVRYCISKGWLSQVDE